MVNYRRDADQGGYDSYVFPINLKHPLWQNFKAEYFRMFNGSLGGEMVSQHNVRPTVPFKTVARCHLNLKVPAVMEIPFGSGWIIISRIQIRGRLIKGRDGDLYHRRYDPVAEQYFWNLLQSYLNNHHYREKLLNELQNKSIFISRVTCSARQIVDIFETKIVSRWSSEKNDLQYLNIDLGKTDKVRNIELCWEVADSIDYRVFFSNDHKNWYILRKWIGSIDKMNKIDVSGVGTRYYRIEFSEHGRKWGLSSLILNFT